MRMSISGADAGLLHSIAEIKADLKVVRDCAELLLARGWVGHYDWSLSPIEWSQQFAITMGIVMIYGWMLTPSKELMLLHLDLLRYSEDEFEFHDELIRRRQIIVGKVPNEQYVPVQLDNNDLVIAVKKEVLYPSKQTLSRSQVSMLVGMANKTLRNCDTKEREIRNRPENSVE